MFGQHWRAVSFMTFGLALMLATGCGTPSGASSDLFLDRRGLPWARPSRAQLIHQLSSLQVQTSVGMWGIQPGDIVSIEEQGWQDLGASPNRRGAKRWALTTAFTVARDGRRAHVSKAILRYDVTLSLAELPADPMFLTHNPTLLDTVFPGLFSPSPAPDMVEARRLRWSLDNRTAEWVFVDCVVVD